MIKLTKPEINALIHNYFTQESFIYTAFVFKNELKDDLKNIRRDITLEKILTYGLQYMYGVDHYKDGKVNICTGVYSLDRLHLCDVVVKNKKIKKQMTENVIEEDKSLSNDSIDKFKKTQIEKQTNSLCIKNKNIKENENSINIEKLEKKSSLAVQISVKSLEPCKPCSIVTFKDEYLYLYDDTSFTLYIFKFGFFTGIKNIALKKMIYVDDILVMYDGTKLIFHNTFNLKLKSILHNCKEVLYDGNKFVTLNLDGTISFFTRDGIKTGDNLFISQNLCSGCIINSHIIIWNESGRVFMTNSKSHDISMFPVLGKKILSFTFYDDVLYLLHEDVLGIYNIKDKTNHSLDCKNMQGLCKTQNYILTFANNLIQVYKENAVYKLFDTKKNIRQIINLLKFILVMYNNSIEFYDQDMYFIKEYECFDYIESIAINGKEICILLKTKSPILLSIA